VPRLSDTRHSVLGIMWNYLVYL